MSRDVIQEMLDHSRRRQEWADYVFDMVRFATVLVLSCFGALFLVWLVTK